MTTTATSTPTQPPGPCCSAAPPAATPACCSASRPRSRSASPQTSIDPLAPTVTSSPGSITPPPAYSSHPRSACSAPAAAGPPSPPTEPTTSPPPAASRSATSEGTHLMNAPLITLAANAVADPTLRFTGNATPVANLPVANTERANRTAPATYLTVTVWNAMAETSPSPCPRATGCSSTAGSPNATTNTRDRPAPATRSPPTRSPSASATPPPSRQRPGRTSGKQGADVVDGPWAGTDNPSAGGPAGGGAVLTGRPPLPASPFRLGPRHDPLRPACRTGPESGTSAKPAESRRRRALG